MRKAPSRDKDPEATERLPTKHPSIQKEYDPIDDEAVKAASKPIGAAAERHNPLNIAEIASQVASRAPDAAFPNEKKPTKQLNAKSQLALTTNIYLKKLSRSLQMLKKFM